MLTPDMFERTTTFLLGSEKHAGKTTLLNYLIRRLRGGSGSRPVHAPGSVAPPPSPLAYLSVGVDGEGRDLISGTPKPQVVAAEGDYLVTAEQALRRSDLSAEIHEVFPFNTVLGPPVLARVVRGGPVELVGPGGNTQLAQVLEHIVVQAGVETVLVDGAINRVTQVAASTQGACLLVLRVTRVNLARAIEMLRRLYCLQDIPVVPTGDHLEAGTLALDGALTAERLHTLDAACRTIIVEDFSRVFLTRAELQALQQRVQLRLRRRFEFRAFVVNLYDLSHRAFLDALSLPELAEKVVFNPYAEAA